MPFYRIFGFSIAIRHELRNCIWTTIFCFESVTCDQCLMYILDVDIVVCAIVIPFLWCRPNVQILRITMHMQL